MLSFDEVKQYLAVDGITLPDFLLTILLEDANAVDACMQANGYTPNTIKLIKLYLISLLAMGQGNKYVTSQTAPSGASRSFKYATLADRWNSTIGLLRRLDKAGCTAAIIPPNPTATANAGIWVSSGTCDGCGVP